MTPCAKGDEAETHRRTRSASSSFFIPVHQQKNFLLFCVCKTTFQETWSQIEIHFYLKNEQKSNILESKIDSFWIIFGAKVQIKHEKKASGKTNLSEINPIISHCEVMKVVKFYFELFFTGLWKHCL